MSTLPWSTSSCFSQTPPPSATAALVSFHHTPPSGALKTPSWPSSTKTNSTSQPANRLSLKQLDIEHMTFKVYWNTLCVPESETLAGNVKLGRSRGLCLRGIGLGAPIIGETDEEDKRGREEDAKLKAALKEDE
ncbi:uncharacterized protein RAG0_15113 [Rhynchosporium agropyri]|uniref:Uncharacterized protein n=1 Tax=Rhynchosporium agropyri TaxID=914238 RepID=A0A1E1LJN2_9HELO|nr:uncharacterized protein RAG0_15113 [Rhynchosporium agropyri]